ncbi:MAG: signal peptidase I [Rhizomicrobium sp.]
MSDDDPEKLIDELTQEPAPPAAPRVAPPAAVEPPEPEAAPGPAGPYDSWIELAKTIFYALLIALVIRTILFQPFNIPSGSMRATLLVGDFVFVEKFSYGYSRYSWPQGGWPLGSLFNGPGRVLERIPHRGDVVVFKFPGDNSTDYIKRLIGLPGDRIQMKNGVLWLNGKPVPKQRVDDLVETDAFGLAVRTPQYRETLPGGKTYLTLDKGPSEYDDTGVFVVPAGHYFMMGDNRDESDDSRGDVGYVPSENLVGRAELRFLSIDDSAIWYEPWTWPGAIRFSRMFTFVD